MPRRKFRRSAPVSLSECLTDWLQGKKNGQAVPALHYLWQSWDMVLGAELAARALPLGTRGRILLIGAEDSMELQELRMEYENILSRANAFMLAGGENEYFEKAEFSLLRGRTPLNRAATLPALPPRFTPARDVFAASPPRLEPGSPLARLYEAYQKCLHRSPENNFH